MKWIYGFTEDVEGDARALLGGKGASLASMTRAGLNVPPGFTITTEACAYYYENGRRWPEGLEEQLWEHLERLEKATGSRLGEGAEPLLVSVRSGAAESMPGMMDTLLNCGLHPDLGEGRADEDRFWEVYARFIGMFAESVANLDQEVLIGEGEAGRAKVEGMLRRYRERTGKEFPLEPRETLKACVNAVFESWSSERAVAYRARNGIEGLRGTAVNVQAMFPSRLSGIVFTLDPNHLEEERMVIECSHGLGESVVSGEVTPDRFLVKRDDFRDVIFVPGEKAGSMGAFGDEEAATSDDPTLSEAQLKELCDLSLRVEAYFGMPVDIEFGWAKGDFALLQSRAIRGLDLVRDAAAARREEIARLRELADGDRRVWVAHNLGETLRFPTPLTWDIVRHFMSGDGGYGLMYRDFGYRASPVVREKGFLELILGRIYADPDRLAQMYWDGMPMTYDMDAVAENPGTLDLPPTRFLAERADERFLRKLPGVVGSMFRASRRLKKLRGDARRRFEEDVLPDYLAYVREKREQDLTALDTPALLGELDDRRRRVLDEFGKESLKPPFFAGSALSSLEAVLMRLFGETEGARMAADLTAGLDHDTTFEQDVLLSRVAAGEVDLDEFLEAYGHRATNEMELSEPRWREDPGFLETVLKQMRNTPPRSLEERHRENVERAAAARRELPAKLAAAGGASLREDLERDLERARELLPFRETGKHYLMMGYELIRRTLEELGRRWGLGVDIYYLTLDELPRWKAESEELRGWIEARRLRWKSAQRLYLPDVVDSGDLEGLGEFPESADDGSVLEGEPVSPGLAEGKVRIVFNPREVTDPGEGYILVCPSTDPGWTPLFVNARGLIVERGGVLSHGAIVARDFGIPAVVCPMATTRLREGESIQLDGNRGRVLRGGEEG